MHRKELLIFESGVVLGGLYPQGCVGEIALQLIIRGGCASSRSLIVDELMEMGCTLKSYGHEIILKNEKSGMFHAVNFSHKTGMIVLCSSYKYKLYAKNGRLE